MTGQIPVLFFSLFVTIRITEQLKWTTEKLSTTCCEGKNQLLIWNFTEGENENIIQLQWYFNKTTLMSLFSVTLGFHVAPSYKNRIERDGRAGIVLKNVSLNDTGEYTLYPKIAEEKTRNAQAIVLTVIEPPRYSCKPTVEIHSENVVSCSTASCERSQSSLEWIINGTRELVGNGRYLTMNSSMTSETVLCCPRGMKCYDGDQLQLCTPNPISFKEDIPFKTDIRTKSQFENITVKASNHEGNETMNQNMIILAGSVVALTLVVILTLVAYFTWRRSKSVVRTQNSNTAEQVTGETQPLRSIVGPTVVRPQDSKMPEEFTEEIQPLRTTAGPTVLTSQISNMAEQVTEDIQPRRTISGPTDKMPLDSNWGQNVQIVNNIIMDADVLKCVLDSHRVLMTEYLAAREENRKLKEQLHRYKHSKGERPIEMTTVNSSDPKQGNTDTLYTTSGLEDALSAMTQTSDLEDQVSDVDTTLNHGRGFD